MLLRNIIPRSSIIQLAKAKNAKQVCRATDLLFVQKNCRRYTTEEPKNTEQAAQKEIKRVRIYTKTGDKGKSSLFDGTRRRKDDAVFEALGTVDELNAHIGVAYEFSKQASNGLYEHLEEIQSRLLDVGSCVATPLNSLNQKAVEATRFDGANTQRLEHWIDELDTKLPPLRNFILPSGGLASAQLHVARSVCRRAERSLVPLLESEQIGLEVYQYMNRLSDFLFVSARYAAMREDKKEVVYKSTDKK
jgi:cob(I)alamin adenosyltransferase